MAKNTQSQQKKLSDLVPDEATNTQKDPSTWTTGDEPMTGAQRSYLHTLAEQAGVDADDSLTKGEASEQIDQLRQQGGQRSGDAVDNTQKDPSHWKTGGEPMTGAQRSYLHTLADEVGAEVDDDLTKSEASQEIDSLRHQDQRVK